LKALIIHYGVGNVFSIENAFRRLGFEIDIRSKITGDEREYDCLILPGVGSFTAAVENISLYRGELVDLVTSGIPVLGICLGMQLLFEESEEGPGEGLKVFKGRVKQLPDNVKKPHMGWNKIRKTSESPLLEGINEAWVYFNHTYYPAPDDSKLKLAETEYGIPFASIIGRGEILGTQFHPEKSSKTGLVLLTNFKNLVRR